MIDLIEKLEERCKAPMPGLEYQSKMLPGNRLRTYPDEATLAAARQAGVCMLLYQKEEEWYTVIIQRTTYKGVHSGQMAFPGGTKELEDVDLTATALREMEEEVGVSPQKVKVLGKLSPVYIPPSNMYVEPILAYSSEIPIFQKEEREVAEIVEVKIMDLTDPNIIKEKVVQMTSEIQVKTPCFDVYGYTVWGATAAMIYEFLQVLKEINFK